MIGIAAQLARDAILDVDQQGARVRAIECADGMAYLHESRITRHKPVRRNFTLGPSSLLRPSRQNGMKRGVLIRALIRFWNLIRISRRSQDVGDQRVRI